MIIKVNKDIEDKLNVISSDRNMKMDKLIVGIFTGFFERYEEQNGFIKTQEKTKTKKSNHLFTMLHIFKKKHLEYFEKEYISDKKQEMIDLKNLKVLQGKIIKHSMGNEEKVIHSVNDHDIINAFEFLLTKMPDWWKKNAFTIPSISKNFDKIVNQIQNGVTGKKEKLDDFLSRLENN